MDRRHRPASTSCASIRDAGTGAQWCRRPMPCFAPGPRRTCGPSRARWRRGSERCGRRGPVRDACRGPVCARLHHGGTSPQCPGRWRWSIQVKHPNAAASLTSFGRMIPRGYSLRRELFLSRSTEAKAASVTLQIDRAGIRSRSSRFSIRRTFLPGQSQVISTSCSPAASPGSARAAKRSSGSPELRARRSRMTMRYPRAHAFSTRSGSTSPSPP